MAQLAQANVICASSDPALFVPAARISLRPQSQR